MKVITLFLTFALTFNISIGVFSSEKSDSLIQVLSQTNSDSIKTIVLADLSFDLCYSFPDSALVYGIESLRMAQKNKNFSGVALAYNRIGIVLDVTNKWDSALVSYNYAIQYALIANDSMTLASAYNNVGLIYWNKTEYDLALEYYFKSLKVFELINKEKGVANTLNNISLIYWEQNEISKAINYQYQALKIRQKVNDAYGTSASLVNLGMLYDEVDSFELSINFYQQGIDLKQNIHDDYGLAIAYTDLGITYDHLDQHDSAQVYLIKGAKLHESNNSFGLAASSYLSLSSLYLEINAMNDAEQALHLAERLAISSESYRVLSRIYRAQADLYLIKEKYKLSATYYKKYIPLQDSLYNLEKIERLKTIEQQFLAEKKDKEIAQLKNDKLAKDLLITQNEVDLLNARLILFIVFLILVLLAFISILFFHRTRVKNEQEKSQLIIASNKKMLLEIFNATETERQRIGKDLHDGIGQQLSGIKLALSSVISADQTTNNDKLLKIAAILDESATDLRLISHQMMPKTLNELGLIAAIKELFEKSFSLSNIQWQFEAFNVNQKFSPEIEIGLYRIAQELINNIIKHAKATQVDAQLYIMNNDLILLIIDNGIGFNKELMISGHGFNNINARLQSLNGKIKFENNLPSGVEVTVTIKL